MDGLRTFLICGLFLATTLSGNSLILTVSCANEDFEQLVARLIGH